MSVSQSVITTLLPTEHMVARPTTHAVHNRECCLLRAQISGTRCAHSSTQVRFALGGTPYAENWHRASRDFLPFGFALFWVQRRSTLPVPRHSAVPVATLGSRDSAWFTDHAVVLSGSKSESECKGTRAHAHARRARAREKTHTAEGRSKSNKQRVDRLHEFLHYTET